jgi:branched-chain amino acid transport system permease protein
MSTPDFALLGFTISGERQWYWVFVTILIATLWLAANLVDSPAGRALCALRGSETAARTLGVDAASFKARVFTLSAIATAAMGALYASYIGFITPSLAAFPKSIELVTMVVVGGMASIWGSVVGAGLLSLLPELLARYEGSETIVFGLILLLTMILMPRGIVPTLAAALARRSS